MEQKVSIIVPVFNAAKYIEGLLDTILNQTHKNIEIILVDDESRDNSVDIIKESLNSIDCEYYLIQQTNSGAASARNHGLNYATGDYVVFVDADDLLHNRYIELLLKVALTTNSDIAICGFMNFMDENHTNLIADVSEDFEILDQEKATVDFALGLLKTNHWAMLYNKNLLILNNLQYPTNFKYGEDVYFATNCMAYSKKIAIIHDQLYFYRSTNTSLMGNITNDINTYVNNSMNIKIEQEKIIQEKCPTCFDKYTYFAIPRVVFSLVNNISVRYSYIEYRDICKTINARDNLRRLIKFPDKKIRIASFIFLISPRMFKLINTFRLRL
ncbi:glycosyltransferase family A protein [Paenibacillus sp. FSL H8-0261]|uniref:glycosyltransferase family A protein n=1 Tax=Paenibacillus sp. FSL H8-0261 TaxID=2921381 RepID=UPI003250D38A